MGRFSKDCRGRLGTTEADPVNWERVKVKSMRYDRTDWTLIVEHLAGQEFLSLDAAVGREFANRNFFCWPEEATNCHGADP